jgi:hypothetical protein
MSFMVGLEEVVPPSRISLSKELSNEIPNYQQISKCDSLKGTK